MAYLNDRVLDFGLDALTQEVNRLDICSDMPSDYGEATDTYSLGNKTSHSVGSPAPGDPDGRQVESAPVEEGSVTATGEARWYALSDTSNNRLLAAGQLTNQQVVTDGNEFTLTSFTIRIPAPE